MLSPRPSAKPYKDSSGLRKWVFGCFVIFPIFCCGGGVLISRKWVDVFDQSRNLDQIVAKAKARGFPFEAKELAMVPAVAKADNAKDFVVKLEKDFGPKTGLKKAIAAFKPEKDREMPKKMLEFLDRARAITKFKAFDGEKDLDLATYVKYPEFGTYKDMARVFAFSAELNARRGRSREAIMDIEAIRQLANQLSSSSSEIGGLVVLAIDAIYGKTALHIAQYIQSRHEDLTPLRQVVTKELPSTPFENCLRSEFYVFVALSRNQKVLQKLSDDENLTSIDKLKLVRSGLPSSILWRGQLGSFIEHFLAIDDIFRSDSNLIRSSKRAEAYVTAIPTTVSNYVPILFLSSATSGSVAWERNKIRQKIVLRCIDLLQSQPSSGFPNKIEPIADPFGSGNLVYKRTKAGFMIYSVGSNGKDDGGPKQNPGRKNSDDLGFEYPFVKKS